MLQKDRRSLQVVAFNTILFISTALILLIGAVTLLNNYIVKMKEYKRETANIMEYAVSLLGTSYLEKAYNSTKKLYNDLPEEIAKDQFSEEYIDYFLELIDEDFWNAYDSLALIREKNKLASLDFIFLDHERKRAVYIIDASNIEEAYIPGQWLSEEDNGIDTQQQMDKVASSKYKIYVGYGDVSGWIATNYLKVYDANGEFLGYCTCDINVTYFIKDLIVEAIVYILICMILIAIVAYRVSRIMRKKMIIPINTLAMTAEEYTKRDKAVEDEDKLFFEGLNIHTNDEIETLYHSLTDMELDIKETMGRIRMMTAEKEKAAAEMDLAARIQVSMLPGNFPLFPDHSEFDIYASMDPAKEVGGDFYDAFLIDPSHLCLVIADVSGKGVPAALFMVISKTVIKHRARMGGSPSEIIEDVNKTLCEGNSEMMFVTVWLAILDITTGEMISVNAGHENPVLMRKNGECELIKTVHGMVLGAVPGLKYENEYCNLSEGDRFFVYTDGLPEATNSQDERLTEPVMFEIIQKHSADDNRMLLQNIRSDVDSFVKDAPQFDDLTMLVIEYKGKSAGDN